MSFFIEVGSCNFDTCERLINNGWSGIVIEPVKYYFDKLPKYPHIKYENIAISDKKSESEIHYINPEYIKNKEQEWLKGISSIKGESGPLSFDNNIFMKENTIIQKVNTDTLKNICDKYNVTSIDFLKIDTEGHDIKVLESIDLDKIYVKMIKIEHKHVDKEYLKNYLQNYSYLVYTETDDIYAIK